MRQRLRRVAFRLFEPVDGASLAVFRILFGAILTWEVALLHQQLDRALLHLVEPLRTPLR